VEVVVTDSDDSATLAQTFTITVTDVNEAPTAITGDLTTVAEGITALGTLVTTDPDATNVNTWVLATTGTTCSVATNNEDNIKFNLVAATGVLTFATAPNFEVPTDVAPTNSYHACVQVTNGAFTFQKAVAVNVTNVNEDPVLTFTGYTSPATAYIMSEDGAPTAFPGLTTHLSATDVDAATTLTWSVSLAATHGTATVSGTGANPAVFTYAPTANYAGTDSFTVQVSDGALTATKLINVTITPVDDALPTNITLSAATVAENSAIGTEIGTLATVDVDLGETFAYTLSTVAPTCNGAGVATDNAKVKVVSDALQVNAALNFEAPLTSLKVCLQTTNAAIPADKFQKAFTITVTNVNEAPVITVTTGTVAVPAVVAEDSATWVTAPVVTVADPETGTTTFDWAKGTDPAHGAVVVTGTGTALPTIVYTPAANYNGLDSFTITASDGSLTSAAATINVRINAVNDPPTFTAGAAISIPCNLTTFSTATAWATGIADIDLPAQTLAFTANLTTPVVTGITSVAVNSTTGIATINLAETACAATGTKTVPITLTDNGSPVASVSHDMTVYLTPVYSISGTITAPAGFGLIAGGTTVTFAEQYSAPVSLLDGTYTITGIAAGTTGSIVPEFVGGSGYQFDKNGGAFVAGDDYIVIGGGGIVADLPAQDFAATGTRSISGTITGPNGARLPVGTVIDFSTNPSLSGLILPASVGNGGGATPTFTLSGLPPKNYLLIPVITTGAAPILNGKLLPAAIAASTAYGNDTVGNAFTFGWTPATLSGTIKTSTGALPLGKVFTIKLDGTGSFAGQSITGTYVASTSTYTIQAPYAKIGATADSAPFTGTLNITGTGYQNFAPLVAYTGVTAVNNVVAYGDRSIFGAPLGATIADGVTIDFGGGLSSPVESGYFSLSNLERKSYTLTPTAAGYFFTLNATNFNQVKPVVNVTAGDVDLSTKFYAFVVPTLTSATPTITNNVVFIWSNGALSPTPKYKVQYATNTLFTTGLVSSTVTAANATTASMVAPAASTPAKTYYWRVVPMNAAGTAVAGPASETGTFLR
jgi:VCBS repeat-containing protein